MFDVFKNAWKVEDIREKLLYTLLIIVVFRLGAYDSCQYGNSIPH